MADPRPAVDVLETPGLGEGAFYDDDTALTAGQFNRRLDLATAHLRELFEQSRQPHISRPVDVSTSHQTDSSGNVTFPIYQVGAGLILCLESLTVECATFDTTNPRTPAAPFTAASCWLGIFSSPNPNSVGQGWLIDFMPTTAGQQVIPATGEYNPPRYVRSQQYLVLYLAAGPTSQLVSVHMTGRLEQNS